MFKFFVIIVAVLAVCGLGIAGPTPPSDWGHDCTNWVNYTVPYGPRTACYAPTHGEFIDCQTGANIVWPGLDIEMWIEAECTFSWEATEADVHRGGSQEAAEVCLTFAGNSSCNIPTYVVTHAPYANAGTGQLGNLDFLPFISNVPGAADDGFAPTHVPLVWKYSIDGGAFVAYNQTGNERRFYLPSCNHPIAIMCCLEIPFHQRAGYYHLGGDGASICPAEGL
jgi:hypothetical protein